MLALRRSGSVLLIVLSASAAIAQVGGGSSACNNQTRQVAIVAGYHNELSDDCQQITISVAGQSFQSPSRCKVGWAKYAGTVYTCGVSAEQIHCETQGYKVPLTLASGGGCPDLIGLTPGSWPSWGQVPAAIVAALRCAPPELTETFDWSASTRNCTVQPSAVSVPGVGEEHMAAGAQSFLLWLGDPTALCETGSTDLFLSPFDRAQVAETTHLPAEWISAASTVTALVGARLEAEVRVEHFGPSNQIRSRSTARLAGAVLSDGRFDLEESKAVEQEGRVELLTTRLRFDGGALFEVCSGAELGNVYLPDYVDFERTAHVLCHRIEPLFRWVAQPVRMAAFPEALYSVETQDGVHRVSRWTDWGGQQVISDTLRIGAVDSLPLSWSVFDSTGRTRHFVSFEGYRELAPGAWRPTRVVETTYLEGESEGPRVVVTTRVIRATPLEDSVLGAVPFFEDQIYQVWR